MAAAIHRTAQIADAAQHHEDQNQNRGVVIKFLGNQRRIIQRIQNTGNASKDSGGHKGHQLILGDGNAHRTGCNLVITDGSDGTARTGIHQNQNHQQRHDDQNNTDGKVGRLGNTGDALSTVDQHFAVLHVQGAAVLQGEVQAVGIHAQIAGVHDVFDDLAESQRNNGQIVTRQAQNGHTYQEAKDTGHQTAHHKRRAPGPEVWES